MADRIALDIVNDATGARPSYGDVPALEIFDRVMEGRHGCNPDFGDPVLRWDSWAAPGNEQRAALPWKISASKKWQCRHACTGDANGEK